MSYQKTPPKVTNPSVVEAILGNAGWQTVPSRLIVICQKFNKSRPPSQHGTRAQTGKCRLINLRMNYVLFLNCRSSTLWADAI